MGVLGQFQKRFFKFHLFVILPFTSSAFHFLISVCSTSRIMVSNCTRLVLVWFQKIFTYSNLNLRKKPTKSELRIVSFAKTVKCFQEISSKRLFQSFRQQFSSLSTGSQCCNRRVIRDKTPALYDRSMNSF